ncbi:hypothetical protein IQ13_3477 [Lacibacter cauensis]|uniref:Uncharacterized protein n=1 Tax=Lacibacter cauensis TaxID=510947 RepID=A0A562SCM5_9BACT|nr:hypothetical protein IQ13_3477 [Lacibacter cauensis]
MPPVFWEGKGNGKQQTEKFLQKKYQDFYKKVESKKKPSVCGGLLNDFLEIVLLFFFSL